MVASGVVFGLLDTGSLQSTAPQSSALMTTPPLGVAPLGTSPLLTSGTVSSESVPSGSLPTGTTVLDTYTPDTGPETPRVSGVSGSLSGVVLHGPTVSPHVCKTLSVGKVVAHSLSNVTSRRHTYRFHTP